MQNFIRAMFKTFDRGDLPAGVLRLGRLLGLIGAVLLVTGAITKYPLLHLIGSTVCVLGMIWFWAIYGIKSKGFSGMMIVRDVMISVFWIIVMIPWLLEII